MLKKSVAYVSVLMMLLWLSLTMLLSPVEAKERMVSGADLSQLVPVDFPVGDVHEIDGFESMKAHLEVKEVLLTYNQETGGSGKKTQVLQLKPGAYKLTADFELNEDEINMAYPEAVTDYGLFYASGICLDGQGHRITLSKDGGHGLFNQLKYEEKGSGKAADNLTVKNLGLTTQNIVGAPFATYIRGMVITEKDGNNNIGRQTALSDVENIDIQVNGDILPLYQNYGQYGINYFSGVRALETAAGFAIETQKVNVKGLSIAISGNIGSDAEPVNPETQACYAFGISREIQGEFGTQQRDLSFMEGSTPETLDQNSLNFLRKASHLAQIKIEINGDIVAAGPVIAGAAGIANTADAFIEEVDLYVKGDIRRIQYGGAVPSYGSAYDYIGLTGYEMAHLMNTTVNVDGNLFFDRRGEIDEPNRSRSMLMLGPMENLQGYMDFYYGNNVTVKGNIVNDNGQGLVLDVCGIYGNRWGKAENTSDAVIAHNKTTVMGKTTLVHADLIRFNGMMFRLRQPGEHFLMTKKNEVDYGDIHLKAGYRIEGGLIGSMRCSKAEDVDKVAPFGDAKVKAGNIIIEAGNHEKSFSLDFGLLGMRNYAGLSNIEADIGNVQLIGREGTSLVHFGGMVAVNNGENKAPLENIELRLGQVSYQPRQNGGKLNAAIGGMVGRNNGTVRNAHVTMNGFNANLNGTSLNFGGAIGKGEQESLENLGVTIEKDVTISNGNYVNAGGFGGTTYHGKQSNCAAQIGGQLTALDNSGMVNVGGYIAQLFPTSALSIDNGTALVFGDIKVGSSGSGPHSNAGFIGAIREYQPTEAPLVTVANCAAYVGGELNQQEYSVFKGGAVGHAEIGDIKRFTVLGNKSNGAMQIRPNDVIGYVSNKVMIDQLFFVEVAGDKRTAYQATITDGKFEKLSEKPVAVICIAARDFQSHYWGRKSDEAKNTFPYTDLPYIYDDGGMRLDFFSPDRQCLLAGSDGRVIQIVDYTHRHLAATAAGVTYDILGIYSDLTSYELRYDANGAEGDVPVDDKGPYAKNDVVTVLDNDGDKPLRIVGWVFNGWNTKADGSGKAYQPGEQFKIKNNMRLYAQWRKCPIGDGPSVFPGNTGDESKLNLAEHFAYLFGYPDNTFRPTRSMSRAEVVAMFSRLLQKKPEVNKIYPSGYRDISFGQWHYNVIGYMSQLDLVKGYENGEFRPDQPITRAEFSAIASRFDHLSSSEKVFSDVQPTHWAAKVIASAAAKGWVSGYPDGCFRPDDPISRAEVVSITNRMLNRSADQDYVVSHQDELIVFKDNIKGEWAYYEIFEATNGHDFERKKNGKDERWLRINNKAVH